MSDVESWNPDQSSPLAGQGLMFCPNCGKPRVSEGEFCNYCGFQFETMGSRAGNGRHFEEQQILPKVTMPGKKTIFSIKNNRVICAAAAIGATALIVMVLLIVSKKNYCIKNFENAEVGQTICFGSYEQDNNTSNGKEAIEWIVLAKEENRMLVTSKYGLDAKPYNEEEEEVTWEKCTLRKWLNGNFLNEAFNADEKSRIFMSRVTADKNPECNTDPGEDTEDNVFLLSISDAIKYFSSEGPRILKPTEYAVAQGARRYEWNKDEYPADYKKYNGYGWWWLRSPGCFGDHAGYVTMNGAVGWNGVYVNQVEELVRPAMWINL